MWNEPSNQPRARTVATAGAGALRQLRTLFLSFPSFLLLRCVQRCQSCTRRTRKRTSTHTHSHTHSYAYTHARATKKGKWSGTSSCQVVGDSPLPRPPTVLCTINQPAIVIFYYRHRQKKIKLKQTNQQNNTGSIRSNTVRSPLLQPPRTYFAEDWRDPMGWVLLGLVRSDHAD